MSHIVLFTEFFEAVSRAIVRCEQYRIVFQFLGGDIATTYIDLSIGD
jgi:hypothetical protein